MTIRITAERYVLRAFLLDDSLIDKNHRLHDSDFSEPINQAIFNAIQLIRRLGGTVNAEKIISFIKDYGLLVEKIFNVQIDEYVSNLIQQFDSVNELHKHIEYLLEVSAKEMKLVFYESEGADNYEYVVAVLDSRKKKVICPLLTICPLEGKVAAFVNAKEELEKHAYDVTKFSFDENGAIQINGHFQNMLLKANQN